MGTRAAPILRRSNLLGFNSPCARTRRALAKLKQPDRSRLAPYLNMDKDNIKLNDTDEFVEVSTWPSKRLTIRRAERSDKSA